MFRNKHSTEISRSDGPTAPQDRTVTPVWQEDPHTAQQQCLTTTSTTSNRHHRRRNGLSSHLVACLVLALAIGCCHAKRQTPDTSPTSPSRETDSSSLLYRQQQARRVDAPTPPSAQDIKWLPSPTSDEDVLDLTDHRHQKRRHRQRRPQAGVNANRTIPTTTTTTISLYDRLAAAKKRHQALPKRTMPHYLAILNGEEVVPASATRWREVNDSAVRPPRLHPLRPPSPSSAEDYFGHDDVADDAEGDDDGEDGDLEAELDVLRPSSAGRQGARDAVLKSSKDALIVTKKSYLKKDWCKTEPLVQRVREAGCLTRTIVNRFCYGQCNSFYIPKNTRQDIETSAFKSCSFCKPKRFTWITITLRCPGRNPPYKRKRIQRIKKCKCISEILQ